MTRSLTFLALAACLSITATLRPTPGFAEEPKKTTTVDLSGSLEDLAQLREVPVDGVIVSQKVWERLAAAWGIKDVPKVDFTKEFLLVGTYRGSSFKFLMEVKNGDLKAEVAGDKEDKTGFRYKIVSISRVGITKVNGKALPKE